MMIFISGAKKGTVVKILNTYDSSWRDDYLVITLDYSERSKLKIGMKYYIDNIVEEFPNKISHRLHVHGIINCLK